MRCNLDESLRSVSTAAWDIHPYSLVVLERKRIRVSSLCMFLDAHEMTLSVELVHIYIYK